MCTYAAAWLRKRPAGAAAWGSGSSSSSSTPRAHTPVPLPWAYARRGAPAPARAHLPPGAHKEPVAQAAQAVVARGRRRRIRRAAAAAGVAAVVLAYLHLEPQSQQVPRQVLRAPVTLVRVGPQQLQLLQQLWAGHAQGGGGVRACTACTPLRGHHARGHAPQSAGSALAGRAWSAPARTPAGGCGGAPPAAAAGGCCCLARCSH